MVCTDADPSVVCPVRRFEPGERSLLLGAPGIGEVVVRRLEALGITSLRALRSAGVGAVVERICSATGQPGWANRRRALEAVLAQGTARDEGPVEGISRRRAAGSGRTGA